jgi:hypothetical protein
MDKALITGGEVGLRDYAQVNDSDEDAAAQD